MTIELKMYVTNPTLYAYIWDPLPLVKVGYDILYYFIKFISLCKINPGTKMLGDYTLLLNMRVFLSCI